MKRTLLLYLLGLFAGSGFVHAGELTNPNASTAIIALGPYCQALSPETMVVKWQTDQPAYGWVEYGETENLGRKQDTVEHGLRRANVRQHRVALEGLRAGTTYWYRVHAKPIRSFGAYKVEFGPEVRSETASFKTLPGPKQALTAVVFNDLHNSLPTFQGVANAVKSVPFDFSLFNGDCLADPAQASQAFTSLAAFTHGVHANKRPAFFVRGNHETRGAYARELAELWNWPGDKPYFAFSAGPVRFLVLDCGEDKSDDHKEYSGLVDFDSFRHAETQWLNAELRSKAFRRATWRVLVVHIPLYPTVKNGGNSKTAQELWEPMLTKARIDLALHAHLHRAAWHPARSVGNPYPLLIGGGNQQTNSTVMVLEADNQRLELRTLNAEGKEVLPVFKKKR